MSTFLSRGSTGAGLAVVSRAKRGPRQERRMGVDGCAMQQAQEHCRALQQEYRALVADSSVLKSNKFKAEQVFSFPLPAVFSD